MVGFDAILAQVAGPWRLPSSWSLMLPMFAWSGWLQGAVPGSRGGTPHVHRGLGSQTASFQSDDIRPMTYVFVLTNILPPVIARTNLKNTLKSTHTGNLYVNPPCFTLSCHQAFQGTYCQTCMSKMVHFCYVFAIYQGTVQETPCWGPYNGLLLILSLLYSPVLS